MRQMLCMTIAGILLLELTPIVRGEDPSAAAILDKAIKALGGQDRLAKAEGLSWKGKYRRSQLAYEMRGTMRGMDCERLDIWTARQQLLRVINGDQSWNRLAHRTRKIVRDELAASRRQTYLQAIPITLVPIRAKGLAYHAVGDEKVGDKLATVLKINGPDGKQFTLYFDKDGGLPVMVIAEMPDISGNPYHMGNNVC